MKKKELYHHRNEMVVLFLLVVVCIVYKCSFKVIWNELFDTKVEIEDKEGGDVIKTIYETIINIHIHPAIVSVYSSLDYFD